MRRLASEVLGVHAAKGKGSTNNGLFVDIGNVGAGEDNTGEDHSRIGRVGSDLSELVPGNALLDPGGVNYWDHHGAGLGISVSYTHLTLPTMAVV